MILNVKILTNSREGSSIPTDLTYSPSIAYHAPPSNYLTSTSPATPITTASGEPTNNLPTGRSPSNIYIFQSLSASATPTIDVFGHDTSSMIMQTASSAAYLPFAISTQDPAAASVDEIPQATSAESNYLPLVASNTAKAAPTQAGPVNGLPYSIKNEILYINSKTLDIKIPTTTTLGGVGVLVVNPTEGIFVSLLLGSPSKAIPSQTGAVIGIQYSVNSGRLYIGDKTVNMASPTTAAFSDGGVLVVDPTRGVSLQILANASGQADHDTRFGVTVKQYIIGAFVPTLLAVLFSIPWNLLASALKEMEPFYQLQDPNGVAASRSLLLDYKNSINVAATVNAFRNNHFHVWGSGLISLFVPLLAPLASETVFIGFVGEGDCKSPSGKKACIPRLSVYPVAARVVQSILALIAILALSLAIALARKKSGVYSNPFSIASVAALFQNKEVVEEFRRIDTHITDKATLLGILESEAYKIGDYKTGEGGSSYGFLIWKYSTDSIANDRRTRNRDGNKYTSIMAKEADDSSPSRSKLRTTSKGFLTHRASVMVYGVLIAGLLALVVSYNQTGGDTPFERFMDSQSFGVTFLFTAVGVGIEMYWALLDNGKQA